MMFRRRANVRVENYTSAKWEAINATFSSGTSETYLTDEVASKGSLQFLGVQRSFSTFTGTAGVFTYSILNKEGQHWKTLAVMWDVPFDYNIWGSNYWNIKVLNKKRVPATRTLFWQMRNSVAGEPVKGEDQWKEVITDDFIFKGCMTSNSNSKVIIKVYDGTTNS